MASRTTFIWYIDRVDYVEAMTTEELWRLFRQILYHVSEKEEIDLPPELRIVWAKIKKQLDNDRDKRLETVEGRSKAWSNHSWNQYTRQREKRKEHKQAKKPSMEQMEQNGTNGTNNKDNNINNNNDINISSNKIEDSKSNADKSATKKSIEERQKEFYNELIPYVDTYGKNMIRSFFNYWSQVNKNGKKMLWEMQQAFELPKRLSTWHGKEHASGKNNNVGGEQLYRNNEERMEQAKREGWIW